MTAPRPRWAPNLRGFALSPGLPLLLLLALGRPGAAQTDDRITLRTSGEPAVTFALAQHRGYPAVASQALAELGWRWSPDGRDHRASLPDGSTLSLRTGRPFAGTASGWIQMVNAPYEIGDTLYLPLQLLTDVLPDRFGALYRAADSRSLELLDPSLWGVGGRGPAPAATAAAGASASSEEASPPEEPAVPERTAPRRDDGVRVVVIDPGHGGVDPGSLGRTRTREKDVTLAVGLALARALEGVPGLEVHLTRDSDVLVPIWERGEIASRLRGERPGVFVSIHANAVVQSGVRGFETYFLSEARTDHEARVAALENSAMELERGVRQGPAQGELGAIISELLNLDFQHWSAELARGVQEEVSAIHPGPDRGVKQGPLAVLTNAMMPAVLVELGFVSNAQEEAVLQDTAFQEEVAEAMARAIQDFFRRYPPGSSAGAAR